MNTYENLKKDLAAAPKLWLVTGAAGFIGSNLVEQLLRFGQQVVALDNFSTGHRRNLEDVRQRVGPGRWNALQEVAGDVVDGEICKRACSGVDYVLHQAALGSVPGSIQNPKGTHDSNVTGFLTMLGAARDAGVKRFVFASSSAVYGDDPAVAKVEQQIGRCLSPYAVSKLMDELYADVFYRCYGLECIGLRYFNIFGPRQDPNGPYAAVIPKWIAAMLQNQPIHINGDGHTSRDFCYVSNVVQANLLAATALHPQAANQSYNIAVGERTTLNDLFAMLKQRLLPKFSHLFTVNPVYRDFQPGDVRHSLADISKATQLLGYQPSHSTARGLDEALDWYVSNATAMEHLDVEVHSHSSTAPGVGMPAS